MIHRTVFDNRSEAKLAGLSGARVCVSQPAGAGRHSEASCLSFRRPSVCITTCGGRAAQSSCLKTARQCRCGLVWLLTKKQGPPTAQVSCKWIDDVDEAMADDH